jgi:uncharacterized hydrophobic protein (TIGR00341 family)
VAVRLLEITHTNEEAETVAHLVDDFHVLERTASVLAQGMRTRVVLDEGKVEKLIDSLQQRFGDDWKGRIVLLKVEATIPRPPEPEESQKVPSTQGRLSREELYNAIAQNILRTPTFIAFALLSSAVAALGLLKDNVAIIIGGMVLAPLLAPNIGLALATTLGDIKLGRKSIVTNILGVSMAFAAAIVVGFFANPDPTTREIASRTIVDNGDILLALVSGAAGALAFTSSASANLIGVMVAVAMMPPLVVCGMMVGSGQWIFALRAGLLLAVNIISVNLAAVATFLAQGILPRQWWKQRASRRTALRAMALWTVLLAILAVLVHYARAQTG